MAAELAAGAVDDRARALAQAAVAGEEALAPGAGQEAEVLRVGLARDRQVVLARERANLGLGQLAEREAQPLQRRAAQRGQHVGLVLGVVGGGAQQAVGRAARVVAGGQRGGAEAVGEVDHRVEADVAVAAHARVRRQARGVLGQPRLDDAGAEAVAQVEREVREAHAVGDRARRAHGAGRAAGGLGVVLGVAPQLERDGDDLVVGAGAAGRRRPRCRRRPTSRPACGRPTARRRPRGRPRRRAPGAARRRPGRRRAACRR